MAVVDTEKSTASAKPVELFRLTGSYNTYRITSDPNHITNSEGVWTSIALEREASKSGTQEDTISLNISLPMDHPMVQEYALDSAPPSLTLEFLRAHRDNLNDTILVWTGEIVSWAIEGRTAKLNVPSSLNYLLQGVAPPPKYQAPCNHMLYDERCTVDPADFSFTGSIATISGRTVGVASLVMFADDEAIGGTITANGVQKTITDNAGAVFTVNEAFVTLDPGDELVISAGGKVLRTLVDSVASLNITVTTTNALAGTDAVGGEMVVGVERRMIMSQSGLNFVISSEFTTNVAVSDPVTIRQGCDHSFTTCKAKFNNGINFSGFPHVPSTNPFIRRIG